MKILLRLACLILLLVSFTSLLSPSAILAAAPTYNWLQFNGDPQHSGANTSEKTILPGNASDLKRWFQVTLPGVADGAPAYLSAVSTSGGVRDLLFMTTKNGWIVALDAHTGATVWSHQNGPGSCHINNGPSACYTTSSPAIDPNLAYVYSYGLDGYVHKYQVGDGTEVTDLQWPELVSLKPFDEKGSSALSIATASNGASYLYVASAGYPGDQGDYQGHITAINLADGSQKVFNAVCSNQAVHFVETPNTPDCPAVQTAIWARPGVVYSAATNRIYMATGNGLFSPASHDWGDTVFALNPDGSGAGGNPLDTYTPADFQQLQNTDADLGSTDVAILPVPASSSVKHLAVQGGKDQLLRLLNLDNLSGQGGTGHTGGEIGASIPVPQGGMVLTQPAVWTNPADGATWVFVATANGLSGLKLVLNGGTPSLSMVWKNTSGGTSPIVAAGVLFYARSGLIQALNPLTGAVLWSNNQVGGIHWESPIVDNGVLYITDESSHLAAYSRFGIDPAAILYNFFPAILR
jgi:hypothetical protein